MARELYSMRCNKPQWRPWQRLLPWSLSCCRPRPAAVYSSAEATASRTVFFRRGHGQAHCILPQPQPAAVFFRSHGQPLYSSTAPLTVSSSAAFPLREGTWKPRGDSSSSKTVNTLELFADKVPKRQKTYVL